MAKPKKATKETKQTTQAPQDVRVKPEGVGWPELFAALSRLRHDVRSLRIKTKLRFSALRFGPSERLQSRQTSHRRNQYSLLVPETRKAPTGRHTNCSRRRARVTGRSQGCETGREKSGRVTSSLLAGRPLMPSSSGHRGGVGRGVQRSSERLYRQPELGLSRTLEMAIQ